METLENPTCLRGNAVIYADQHQTNRLEQWARKSAWLIPGRPPPKTLRHFCAQAGIHDHGQRDRAERPVIDAAGT
jgi:hypothetical protein